MKKILTGVSILSLLVVVMPVLAVNNGAGAQDTGSQQGLQVQNQNQVMTQNEGEDAQIQTNQGLPKAISPRSETATQSMSIVAQKVEELLTTKTLQGGIGQQVRQIAQEQQSAQQGMQVELGNVDRRGGLLRTIIGPNFKALKNMQKQIEQNQLRIQRLTQLQNQLVNQADITQVQEMIQALTDQNTALQERINLEEQSGSLLGWLFKVLTN